MTQHTIVGGGIIGLLTAYYLLESGQSVSILERGSIGQESSWAGGGILSPLYPWRYKGAVTQLAKWSQDHYPELINQLSQSCDIDAEYVTSGLLILDTDELAAAEQWANEFGSTLSPIKYADIRQLESALNPTPSTAIWMPDVAHVRNPRLLKLIRQHLETNGVIIKEGVDVLGFIHNNSQLLGLRTNKGQISTSSVVIACGAWSSKLLASVGLELEIVPVKGQMIMLKTDPKLLRRIVLSGDKYLIPRSDGRILVGSTLEYTGFGKEITSEVQEKLLSFAHGLIPDLKDYSVERQWAGLRPGSVDNVPTISQHTKISGLYINAGHFRNGVVTAPASAQLLTNMLLGQNSILETGPYSLT